VRRDLVHEPDGQRFLSVDHLGGEEQLGGLGESDDPGQVERRSELGVEANPEKDSP
jgi:hypothetical protein